MCGGVWIDAPVSHQLTLTGPSYGIPMGLVPSGMLPGQQSLWSGPGEGEALGWAVWSVGPQQRWTHRHCWTTGRVGRTRAFQRFPGEGKTAGHLYHTHLFVVTGIPCSVMYVGCEYYIYILYIHYHIKKIQLFMLRHLKNFLASVFLGQIKESRSGEIDPIIWHSESINQ